MVRETGVQSQVELYGNIIAEGIRFIYLAFRFS